MRSAAPENPSLLFGQVFRLHFLHFKWDSLKGQKVPLKFSSPINGCQRAEIPIQSEGALRAEKSSISLPKGIRESCNNATPKGSF